MNELQIFNNPQFGEVRTFIESDGEVLLCAIDVAKALGYAKPGNAVAAHCAHPLKRGVGVQTGIKPDGVAIVQEMQMNFIPEGDVFRLAARSSLPGAREFENWIFDEVLPSLRKQGTYTVQPKTQAELIAAQAQLLVDMERKLEAVTERVETAESVAIEAGAKAEQAVQKLDTAIKVYSKPDKDHWVEDMTTALRDLAETNHWPDARFRGKLYKELELSAHKDINARLKRLRERKRQAGMTYKETMALNKLDAIAASKELRLIFEGIVKKYQAEATVK